MVRSECGTPPAEWRPPPPPGGCSGSPRGVGKEISEEESTGDGIVWGMTLEVALGGRCPQLSNRWSWMCPCESCELVNDLEERMSPCKRKVQTQDGDQRKSLLRMQAD